MRLSPSNAGVDDQSVTHTPRMRRPMRRMTGVIAAGVLAVTVLAGCLSQEQQTVQNQINGERSARGIAKLIDYNVADIKAQSWAERLAREGGIRHSKIADGYTSGTWCRLGENVGMGPSLAAVHQGFMNSPSHRANMLDSRFNHVGTGVAKSGGYYYVVHEFVQRC